MHKFPFKLSEFQETAIQGLIEGNHILITAHTGSGKTLPAEFAIEHYVEKSKQQWKKHAHNPDLKALEARSAIGESEALTDLSGLGSFKVLEWSVKS